MQTIRDLNELLPEVKELAEKLIALCKENNINIQIIETYRTQKRQNALYEKGRTTPGNIVTWTKTSKHTERRAFDFVPIIKGSAAWTNIDLFKKVGDLGIGLGLTWGGNWKNPDYGHFEFDGQIETKGINENIQKTEVVNDENHWAYKYYIYLIQKGIDIKDKRFDDAMTRGEVFKLIALIKGYKE